MNYKVYHLGKKEVLCSVLEGILCSIIVCWLLYRSIYAIGVVSIFIPICAGRKKKIGKRRRNERLLLEFKDAMQSVTAALLAGYSLENAWRESENEMTELYGSQSIMTSELHRMNHAVLMNQTLETQLLEFAGRSDCEDIQSFAEVFSFAKRSGGDFEKIIRTTIGRISDKVEVEKEIQTVIAAQKMEQKIMNFVPVFILLYLNVTSADFLAPLYGNLMGVSVMTGAFIVYLGAIKLSEKIMKIEI